MKSEWFYRRLLQLHRFSNGCQLAANYVRPGSIFYIFKLFTMLLTGSISLARSHRNPPLQLMVCVPKVIEYSNKPTGHSNHVKASHPQEI